MRTRKKIEREIFKKELLIKKLESEIIELTKEYYLLSDRNQWFEEKIEIWVIKKRPIVTEEKLIGRVFWNEDFVDEDTKEIITIKRQKVVRVNGEWINI